MLWGIWNSYNEIFQAFKCKIKIKRSQCIFLVFEIHGFFQKEAKGVKGIFLA